MIVARVWLRLLASLLLCLLGTAPASARSCERTGPVFEDRTPQRVTARSVRRDAASVATRVHMLDGGGDLPPPASGFEVAPPPVVEIDAPIVGGSTVACEAPRGRALPRGPPLLRRSV